MVSFPNAKINLGLHVTSRRPDGYHNIETCFYPVGACDVLEILPASKSASPDLLTEVGLSEPKKAQQNSECGVTIELSGIKTGGKAENNLCLKAYYKYYEGCNTPALNIYLHKTLPVGAGLGGGSSDAAFTLRMLNNMAAKPVSEERLFEMAASIGADCAFFLANKPVYASGKGEILTDTPVNLSGKYILLLHPGFPVRTADAYAGIQPKNPLTNLKEVLAMPLPEWRKYLVNDFEDSVFSRFPVLAGIKKGMYNAGAVYASMSGSGSAVYGIFDSLPVTLPFVKESYWQWSGILS
ncbi:MAG: 4-(cytidine 5'-diphospho)-2-C-methyl-D-erythritol kinase [Bacteroidota bacterium]